MIQASLKSLKPDEREGVERLFLWLAVFAEDVVVSVGVFDALTGSIARLARQTF